MKINKLKFARAVICFVLVMVALVQFSSFVFSGSRKSDVKYETVVVGEGDSLWSIAEKYNIRGDVRKKINQIKDFNDLPTATIYKNQVLRVPTE